MAPGFRLKLATDVANRVIIAQQPLHIQAEDRELTYRRDVYVVSNRENFATLTAMHEMSITQSVVDICTKHAAGQRVLSVILEIGELSGVVPEAVEFCFQACTAETLLEGAELTIEHIPPQADCKDCGESSQINSYFDPCPKCGSHRLQIVRGEELRVKELEVA
jgi:hydrogenase nickel incorporation protein HypA/HybF